MTDLDYSYDEEFHKKLVLLQEEYEQLFFKRLQERDASHLKIIEAEKKLSYLRAKISYTLEEEKFAIQDLYNDFPRSEVDRIVDNKTRIEFLKKYELKPQGETNSYKRLQELSQIRRESQITIRHLKQDLDFQKTLSDGWLKGVEDKERQLINHIDKYDGTLYTKDGETFYLDYKVNKKANGFIEIKAFHYPMGSKEIDQKKLLKAGMNLGKSKKEIDRETKVITNLREIFKQQKERLNTLQNDTVKFEKDDKSASKDKTKEDKAYEDYLQDKENIPAKKYKLPDTDNPELLNKSPRTRKAIDRLNNESLVGRKFEFVWVEKQHNKHHASQMLALRFGIAHVHRTIVGKVKSHDVENRVELYLPQYNKVVNCSIEQDPEDGKWGISTFFQLRTDWSVCENSTKDVPSGLAQEIDMQYNLNELVEFHKLIMENYRAVIAA